MVKDNGIQMKGQPYKFKTDKEDNHIRITFNRIPTIIKIIKISNNKMEETAETVGTAETVETVVMDTNNKIINGENIMAGAVVVGEDIIINKIIMKSKKVIP